ncbi:MAG TPA: hypothetical protein VK172_00235 [Lentimicrobium sp.]|nr:hypothetical protein [Lentimicrobium sp.]
MHPVLRNIAAVIAGIVAGSIVNMGIIMISGSIIPLPEGVDMSNTEGLREAMHLLGPQHFLFPFIAHALGTFAGAFLTAYLSVSRKLTLALITGLFFLAGGIFSVISLPSPIWFNVVDLVLAYIPMAYIGFYIAPDRLAAKKTRKFFI